MKKVMSFIILSCLSLVQINCFAAGYNPNQITIDPRTNRAMINNNRPAWDGVYPQADGSTIWIRNGVATVNNRRSSYEPNEQKNNQDYERTNFCVDLVKQSCGPQNQCNQTKACQLATQMEQLKADEIRLSKQDIARYGKVMNKKCQQSLADTGIFPFCVKNSHKSVNTHHNSCQKLVKQSCGSQNQCQSEVACQLSKQLLQRRQQENPNTLTTTDGECNKALIDIKWFPNCEK